MGRLGEDLETERAVPRVAVYEGGELSGEVGRYSAGICGEEKVAAATYPEHGGGVVTLRALLMVRTDLLVALFSLIAVLSPPRGFLLAGSLLAIRSMTLRLRFGPRVELSRSRVPLLASVTFTNVVLVLPELQSMQSIDTSR